MVPKANYHTHTVFCDGTDTAEDMVKQALDLGFSILGFSGHYDPNPEVSLKDIDAYRREIHRLQDVYGAQLQILCGAEVDKLMAEKNTLSWDYTIGSVHYFEVEGVTELLNVDHSPETFTRVCERYFHGDYYAMAENFYACEAGVADALHPTFFGHVDLITRFNEGNRFFDPSHPRYRKAALDALDHLCTYGIPFEINCGAYNRQRRSDFYPERFLLEHLHMRGAEILINADAHQKEKLDGGFAEAVEAARSCGFDHVNLLRKGSGGQLGFEPLGI